MSYKVGKDILVVSKDAVNSTTAAKVPPKYGERVAGSVIGSTVGVGLIAASAGLIWC